MTLNIKWLGVDFGQCIMDPSVLRNPLMFGEIMRDLGRPEEIAERIHRYRRMKEKYQNYSLIKEGHRPEIREYILLRWKDGIQEVSALAPEAKGLLRYYTIVRIEEYGRLAVDSDEDYPELIIIERKPRELAEIVLAEYSGARQYVLTPIGAHHEGGRTDHRFDFTEAEGGLDDLVSQLREVLQDRNKEAKALVTMSGKQKISELEEIRRAMKLRTLTEEADVLGFIEMLLTRVAQEQR